MSQVNITELRQHLPAYVEKARRGAEVKITVRGKVVARIVPDQDDQQATRARLIAIRASARVGDVLSPSGDVWEAAHDPR